MTKRVYTQIQREKKKQASRRWRFEIRKKIITHYGGKCSCCSESRFEFLAIDHVNGFGNKERSEKTNETIWRDIIKNNFPNSYRILCHNCNQALGSYGYCPHKSAPNIAWSGLVEGGGNLPAEVVKVETRAVA
jgi:hypothetical protein